MKKVLYSIIAICLSWGVSPVCAQSSTAKKKAPQPKPVAYAVGQVTDAASKSALQGVQVSSGPFQTITDADGRFRVGVSSLNADVTVGRDGYVTRSVSLRGDSLCDVSLYSSAFRSKMASDVFSSSNTEVSLEEVLSTHDGASVRTIGRSAVAGMGANMFIRGYNSLNANAQPLIIVDGVIWDEQNLVSPLFDGSYFNPLADIDVNDIEDVKILKDASSIYGAKGANGAIYITTKQSHSQVTKITVDASYGFNFRPKTYRTLDSDNYRTYVSELLKGTNVISDQGTTFSGLLGMDPTSSTYSTYHNNNDWSKDVYTTGGTQHYGVGIDGSDDIAKYAITIGYTRNNGTVKETSFDRLNSRINAGITLSRSLAIDASVYFTYINRSLFDDGVNANTSPTFISSIKSPFLLPYSYTDDGSQLTKTLNDVDALGVSNPVAIINNSDNSTKHYRFGIAIGPVWKITKDLTLDGRFSYAFTSTKEHYFSPMTGVSPQTVNGNVWYNTIQDLSMSQNNIYGDVHLTYDKLFGAHHLSLMGGYRIMHSSLKSSFAMTHNTGNDKVTNMDGTLSYTSVDGDNTDWGSMAFMAKAGYTFDNRYDVWGILTAEGSSRFGENADGAMRLFGGSWGFFPSVGANWMIHRENFMSDVRAIDKAVVRLSYGVTGNDDIDGMKRYSYLQGVRYLTYSTGLALGSLANSKLKWETTKKFNVGIDLAFLNDRVGVSFDYFIHNTSDLLNYKTADITSGQESYLYNGGKMKNSGYELSLSVMPLVLKNFSWLTSVDFQHYKNEITELPDGDYTTEICGGEVLTSVGNAAGVFYGYKTKGIFATTEEAQAANLRVQNADASYSSFAAGDVWFDDLNGDGIINEKDKQVIGDPNPTITGSWFNRFTYRRLQLDILCTYALGNDIYNYNRQMLESMSSLWNQTEAVQNRWKVEGQNASMPRAVYGDPMGNSSFSDRWIENGSFFKIKNVKLSYNIPIENTYIHGITVWGAVNNLVTFTKYLGIDPEVSMQSGVLYQGIDNGLLAAGRALYMGVKINL